MSICQQFFESFNLRSWWFLQRSDITNRFGLDKSVLNTNDVARAATHPSSGRARKFKKSPASGETTTASTVVDDSSLVRGPENQIVRRVHFEDCRDHFDSSQFGLAIETLDKPRGYYPRLLTRPSMLFLLIPETSCHCS